MGALMPSKAFIMILTSATYAPLVIAEVPCDMAARGRVWRSRGQDLTSEACLVVFGGALTQLPRGSACAAAAATLSVRYPASKT